MNRSTDSRLLLKSAAAPPITLAVAHLRVAACVLFGMSLGAPSGAQGMQPAQAAQGGAAKHPTLELAPPFEPFQGHAFTVAMPPEWPSDSADRSDSQMVLLEDGLTLGPAHALHSVIRESGAGAWSHWNGTLIFSSSDESDPNTNGRRYVVEYRGPVGLGRAAYAPLSLRDPFARLPDVDAAAGALLRIVPPPVVPPRIVWWYTIDALRADSLFAERNGQRVMPELSHFAEADAVRFEHAYATASFTKTSTASMFTGLWPTHHRVLHGLLPVWPTGVELIFDLDSRFRTLASALSALDYDTWTHLYTLHVRPGDGMLAGFRHLDLDVTGQTPLPVPPPDGRLFVYEHILGVHSPYAPSAAARTRLALPAPTHVDPAGVGWFEGALDADALRELREAYDGEAADADERFAMRLAWLRSHGLWDDTLLIVTADHGEGFLEHGLTQHSNSLYEEAVHVPLLIHFPAGDARAPLHGSSLPHRVSLADLYPTLLALTGAEAPPYALDGASLLPILDGQETDPLARDVVLRCSFTRHVQGGDGDALFVTDAILSGTRKAQFGFRIQSSQDAEHAFRQGDWIAELFDLQADPGEELDLSPQQPDAFLALTARHAAASQPLLPREPSPEGATDPSLRATPDAPSPVVDPADAARLEALRQLGYVR